jgi:uncharacterized protein YdhG (YjbR/CyaY superfamily)
MMPMIKFKTIDEYLSSLSPNVREMMEELRKTINLAAPEAAEVISYNMPAFKFHGILVYFAAHREHVGFYPGGTIVNEVFKDELAGFFTSKGTIRFPLDKKLPIDLIQNIVRYKAKINLEQARGKPGKKSGKN